ncbi:MAG: outer membrane protein assembly factor BamA [Deltaproteobacteria bacterium]|nr:outer membrane protein assembly factor BamA [Deltaproteobacteria bacterium]
MSSALNKKTLHRFKVRWLWYLIYLILLMPTDIIFFQHPATAAEAEPAAVKAKPYKIVFQGNQALNETVLRKAAVDELTAFEKQGQRRSDVDDAAFQMELGYRKAGHAFAAVDYQIEPVAGELVVTFIVSEGPRVILQKIDITGNAAYYMQTLLPFFEAGKSGLFGQGKLLFIKANVGSALSQIRDFYISQGYRDVVVGDAQYSFSDDRTQATVTVSIEEGIRYVVHDILFQGDHVPEAQDILKKSRQELIGQPYFARRRLILRSRLLEIYGNLGYPKTMVDVKEQQGTEPGLVVLAAEITKGPRVTISEILIRGNDKTKKRFIRNRLRLQPGDRFSLERQQSSFRELYKTGLFSKVDLHLEQREGTDRWPLVVEVTEAPGKEVYFEPGWGSYELLRLKVGFQEKSLLGTGRIFGLEATGSFKAQSLVARLSDPWFLNTKIKADLTGFYSRREEPSFTRKDRGGSLLFTRTLTEHVKATGGYGFRMTDISDVDPEIDDVDDVTDYDYASLKAQATYDSRSDLFFPLRGQRSFLSAEYADSFLGSDIKLTRLTGGVRYFFPLTQSTVLAMRYRTGLIVPGKDDFNLPIAERFFNGGENTVRSFKQSELGPQDANGDPVGGLANNVINIELRQRLIGNLTGTLFFDYGNVSPNRTRAEQGKPPYDSWSDIMSDTFSQYFKDFRMGVGFGLQYQLPVGPARVDFAFNPDRDSGRDEDFFVFHFSVGMAF